MNMAELTNLAEGLTQDKLSSLTMDQLLDLSDQIGEAGTYKLQPLFNPSNEARAEARIRHLAENLVRKVKAEIYSRAAKMPVVPYLGG